MDDRADALGRKVPGERSWPGPVASAWDQRSLAIVAGIAVLEVLWLGWFLIEPLPNAQVPNHVVRRGLLVLSTFPEVVPGTRFRDSLLGRGIGELSHLENLPQRLPVALAAALIAAAAVGLGDLAAGALGIRRRVRWPARLALDYGLGAAMLGGLTLVTGRLGWLNPWTMRVGLGGIALAGVVGAWLREIAAGNGSLTSGVRLPEDAADGSCRGCSRRCSRRSWCSWSWARCCRRWTSTCWSTTCRVRRSTSWPGESTTCAHNIYTNMPFDVEMLHLLGMEVMGDWWWGALAGQLLVALFGLAAAVMIFTTAARVSPRAGWIAALVYLSTPWVYRMGVIAYVEGPLCFYQAALVWAAVAVPADQQRRIAPRHVLMGLLAGAAMGCKYTALITSAIPFGLLAAFEAWRRRAIGPLVGFVLGWAAIMGPWLVKNVVDTGDPVYPLGYRVFHGRDWDDAMQAKWQRVHGPRGISGRELARSVVEVAGRSDWQSPLYVALAPLALVAAGQRRLAVALWGLAVYLFFSWWLATHRLDRFWLPILPVLAVLAGLGADWCRRLDWTLVLGCVLGVSVLTCLVYDSTALAGFNEWTGDLDVLRQTVPRDLNAPLARLDARMADDARILLVGQASVFHLRHRVLYNTVFNRERIEELSRDRDAPAFRKALHDLGVTHVYVDWREIERYRQPGNYGFTDYVTPARFAGWVEAGVLGRPVAVGPAQDLYRVR